MFLYRLVPRKANTQMNNNLLFIWSFQNNVSVFLIKMQWIIFNTDQLEVCVENVNHWVRASFYLFMLKNAESMCNVNLCSFNVSESLLHKRQWRGNALKPPWYCGWTFDNIDDKTIANMWFMKIFHSWRQFENSDTEVFKTDFRGCPKTEERSMLVQL